MTVESSTGIAYASRNVRDTEWNFQLVVIREELALRTLSNRRRGTELDNELSVLV